MTFRSTFFAEISSSTARYTTWARDNPDELSAFISYMDAIDRGENPNPPSASTHFGRAMVAAGFGYLRPPASSNPFAGVGTFTTNAPLTVLDWPRGCVDVVALHAELVSPSDALLRLRAARPELRIMLWTPNTLPPGAADLLAYDGWIGQAENADEIVTAYTGARNVLRPRACACGPAAFPDRVDGWNRPIAGAPLVDWYALFEVYWNENNQASPDNQAYELSKRGGWPGSPVFGCFEATAPAVAGRRVPLSYYLAASTRDRPNGFWVYTAETLTSSDVDALVSYRRGNPAGARYTAAVAPVNV